MADTEFEEFRHSFEKLPSHTKTTAPFYSLVHDVAVDEDSPTSSKSDLDNYCDINGDGLDSNTSEPLSFGSKKDSAITVGASTSIPWSGERRRRKLPEIPKNKKSAVVTMYNAQLQLSREMSLADELGSSNSGPSSILVLKCGYLWDDSPESDRLLTDADSGHSTAHSPTGTDGPKSMSPILGISPSVIGGVVYNDVDMLEATHRALHKFIPRHEDEIEIEIGDPIYVQKEADDLWCEGYIGSVETLAHKGTSVVCQAVRRVIGNSGNDPELHPCTLEVSDQGLRMVDRRKRN
uniref:JNK-interacting protein 1-like n=1 Tax=Diabrotica virgifera virgifera TaxID=50390 RepID=A0A6P7GRF9_DIAVI